MLIMCNHLTLLNFDGLRQHSYWRRHHWAVPQVLHQFRESVMALAQIPALRTTLLDNYGVQKMTEKFIHHHRGPMELDKVSFGLHPTHLVPTLDTFLNNWVCPQGATFAEMSLRRYSQPGHVFE